MQRTHGSQRPAAGRLRVLVLMALVAFPLDSSARRQRSARSPRRRGAEVIGRVVQVTARFVYIDIGARFGLRSGDVVRVSLPGRRTGAKVTLVDVWSRGARATLEANLRKPRVGARVVARWRALSKAKPARAVRALPAPERPETLVARWEGIERPAPQPTVARRRPTVRGVAAPRRLRALLRLEYLGLLDLDDAPQSNYHRLGLWSELDVPRVFTNWLSYSHRLRLRYDATSDLDARPFQDSRPVPLVYQLRLGLRGGPWRAELGRTPAAPLGPAPLVDGASTRTRVGPVYIGAFGGLQPRIENLAPTTDATTFGAYTSLRLAGGGLGTRGWFLSADLGFVGSTWHGDLDRSAVSAQARFDLQRRLSLVAEATIDIYAEDHPSQLGTAELTTMVVQADGEPLPWLRVGARFDRYRFVPTRESLEVFPRDFVLQGPVHGLRGYSDAQLGGDWVVGASGGWDGQGAESWGSWVELMLRRASLLRDGDLLRFAAQSHWGNFLRSYGGRLAYELPLLAGLTALGGYGLWRDDLYQLDEGGWRHSVWLGADAAVGRHWLVGVQGETLLAQDERVLQLYATCTYRFWY